MKLWWMFWLLLIMGCIQNQPQPVQEITTTATINAAGLDLKALGELVKQCKTAVEIEQRLNQPGGINNLDLNNTGTVDYIHVTEYVSTNNGRGFSFTVIGKTGEKQEIATIEISNVNSQANVVIAGNPNVYGDNQYYTVCWAMNDVLLWHYLWAPHRYYCSPYHYGHYPGYYHPYRPLAYDDYHAHMTTYTKTTVINKTVVNKTYVSKSPNARYAKRLMTGKIRSSASAKASRTSSSIPHSSSRGRR